MSSLKSIEIPPLLEKIGDYAFYTCEKMTQIDMGNVTQIGTGAFAECRGLTQIDLGNVTKIGEQAFYRCTGLTQIDLTNVQEVGFAVFLDCSSNLKIKVPFSSTDPLPEGWVENWDYKCNAQIIYKNE